MESSQNSTMRGMEPKSSSEIHSDIIWETAIEYSNPDGEPLLLNLARPAVGDGPFPAVLCIHGGGWRRGKREECDRLCRTLAERGYVAATITYRLAPKHLFPGAIHDSKAAVRWLRANAGRYRINPDRIGATGSSAGGHLAQFLGVTANVPHLEGSGGHPDQSSAIACVVNFCGTSDFVRDYQTCQYAPAELPIWFGGPLETHRATYIQASPLFWVTPAAAPTLCVHGSEDKLALHEQSVWLVERLQAAGVEAQLLTLEGAGHVFKGDDIPKAQAARLAFLDKHLSPIHVQ